MGKELNSLTNFRVQNLILQICPMTFVMYEDIRWRLKLSDDKDEMVLLFTDPTNIENQVL